MGCLGETLEGKGVLEKQERVGMAFLLFSQDRRGEGADCLPGHVREGKEPGEWSWSPLELQTGKPAGAYFDSNGSNNSEASSAACVCGCCRQLGQTRGHLQRGGW